MWVVDDTKATVKIVQTDRSMCGVWRDPHTHTKNAGRENASEKRGWGPQSFTKGGEGIDLSMRLSCMS